MRNDGWMDDDYETILCVWNETTKIYDTIQYDTIQENNLPDQPTNE